MKRATIAAGLASLLLAPACLTSTQATRLQTDLDEVKRQVFRVQQETAGTQARLADIDAKLDRGAGSSPDLADLGATIQSLLDQIRVLSEQIRDMEARMARLQQDLRSARARPAPAQRPSAAVGGRGVASGPAAEIFNAAYADYSKGNYELAVMGFTDFLRAHPDHALAPDAQYWIGECLYSQGKFADAADAFDQILGRYPTCDKVPAALLKKAFAQMELGRTSLAVTTLQRLIELHPQSDEARLAKERLKQLGLRSP